MKLIIGLGNPGKIFDKTVHNIGFAIVDRIQKILDFRKFKNQNQVIAWKGTYLEEEIIILKPQTLMNQSGNCILPLMKQFNLEVSDILVIQDDITLLPKKIRFRRKSSSGGHNGVKNIIDQFKSDDFARIKIGVGNDKRTTLDKWVVKKLDSKKWKELLSVEKKVFEMTVQWLERKI